jgi:hypothetical protein
VTHIPNYRTFETQTDGEGDFQVVFGSDIIDFNYINIDAYDAPGKINLTATVEENYSIDLMAILENKGVQSEQQVLNDIRAYNEPNIVYALRYGPRKLRRNEPDGDRKYDPNKYAGYKNVLDIIQEMKPCHIVNNTIIFEDDITNNFAVSQQKEAVIVVNGILKGNSAAIFKDILPSDITNINISTSLLDVHKYTLLDFPAVIEVTTIQGMYRYRQPVFQIGSDIMNTNRTFYSPDYSIESTASTDNRKTLYWNPHLILTAGQPELISFFTSDVKGTYYGNIEGTDAAGNAISADFTFQVE